jgi:hypothetical protein
MNTSKPNQSVHDSGASATSAAEETLRLIASLPAPEGLEKRIEAGLRVAPRKARILPWPALRLDNAWVRAAAAAAIVFVVIGGGWGVVSLVQPSQPVRVIAVPPAAPHGTAPGGFSNAGAMRTPQTLDHPVVAQPAAVPEPTATPAVKSTAKPAAQTGQKPLHRGKSAATGKPILQPAVPPASTKKQPETIRP